jgi:glyoxylase-like metal-dependent hydrolase (beta-lactamase superfamily II)
MADAAALVAPSLAWRAAGASVLGTLAGCASSGGDPRRPTSGAGPKANAAPGSIAEPLADGVWVFRGVPGDIGPDTGARHGNGGFVVGPRGVLVIDAGVSAVQGRERLAAIRAVTRAPIRALVLTHAMQEFIFGATAFQNDAIPALMHADAARLMTARCETCLKTLRRELGDDAMAGTRVPKADRVFASAAEARDTIPDIGRPIRIVVGEPKAQTASPGAVAVLDETSATLFAGALLDAATIPDIQDADLAAWQAARKVLRGLGARRIVPGRGPVGDAAVIDGVDAYLGDLQATVDAFVKAGKPLSDVAEGIELPRFASWDRYDTTHRRNASILYLRRERALILEAKPS